MVAQHHRLPLILDEPFADGADLERRAAHVRRDDVAQPEPVAEGLGPDEAADRTGLDHADRSRGGLCDREEPPVRLRDEELAGEALGSQLLLEGVEVALHDRAEARVQGRRARALVLAHDRRDLV